MEIITSYDVPLVCGAAPAIGCGSRVKPLLMDLEEQSAIKEAWVNRAGTIVAIVWSGQAHTEEVVKPVFSQVEYCDNLIFYRRAALDQLGERLLDANRTIGQPNKITVIFGRKITKQYKGKLQTVIEDIDLPNPVIRSHYGHGFIKQYVRDHLMLRTEAATNNVNDYGVKKAVENYPNCASDFSRSTTITLISSRIFWRPSWTGASSGGWLHPPSYQTPNASQDSSSITLASWR